MFSVKKSLLGVVCFLWGGLCCCGFFGGVCWVVWGVAVVVAVSRVLKGKCVQKTLVMPADTKVYCLV